MEAAVGDGKRKKGEFDSLFPANPLDFLFAQNNGENYRCWASGRGRILPLWSGGTRSGLPGMCEQWALATGERSLARRHGARVCEKETEVDWRARAPRGSWLQANALEGGTMGVGRWGTVEHLRSCSQKTSRPTSHSVCCFSLLPRTKEEGSLPSLHFDVLHCWHHAGKTTINPNNRKWNQPVSSLGFDCPKGISNRFLCCCKFWHSST